MLGGGLRRAVAGLAAAVGLAAVTVIVSPAAQTAEAGQAVPGEQGTHAVHVFAVDSGAGKHGTTAAVSQAMVARLDAEYARESEGALRFSFAGFTALPATTATLCTVGEVERRFAAQVARVPAGESWVVVTAESPACGYAAEGYLGSTGVHMNGHWGAWDRGGAVTAVDVMPLAHELTHNLGLEHAARATGSDVWAQPFAYAEYGDTGSVMGSSLGVRLSAADRYALDLLPHSAVAVATGAQSSATFTVGAPTRGGAGTRLVVVPVAGTRGLLVEFNETTRAVDVRATADLVRGTGRALDHAGTVLLPPLTSGSRALPGGVTVRLDSLAGHGLAATARITVLRAADRTAPESTAALPCSGGARTAGGCTVAPAAAPSASNWKVRLDAGAVDDVFTESATLLLDGQVRAETRRDVRRPQSRDAARTVSFSLPVGTHHVEIRRRDLAGNVSVRTGTVQVAVQASVPRRPMWVGVVERRPTRVRAEWVGQDFPQVRGARADNGYRVRVAGPGLRRVLHVGATSEARTITGLRPGRRYTVSVCAENLRGCSRARSVAFRTPRTRG